MATRKSPFSSQSDYAAAIRKARAAANNPRSKANPSVKAKLKTAPTSVKAGASYFGIKGGRGAGPKKSSAKAVGKMSAPGQKVSAAMKKKGVGRFKSK